MKRLTKGKVYLVGAGPGDPKLITIRGLEAIQKADAIVYDRLASPRLLAHAKPGADKIYVGKLPDRHTMKQEEINQLLVDLALQGKVVTRLKGGDPSIFGRVGEEAELIADHGIAFEIVPGITSAIAVPAYAGIPVTHRDFTPSLAIVTGHESPEKLDSSLNWEQLSTATGTLIFLMGLAKIEHIRNQLVRWGKSADTAVALIRWGTTVKQETLVGTLETIVDQVKQSDFQPPAIIIVGEVVKLRDKLAWFEQKPLFGKRVLITRARSQSSELAERIDELGGEAVEFPVIGLQPPSDEETLKALDRALGSLAVYDWVLFTSVNGVDYFFRRLQEIGIDIRTMSRARIAAVGPKTADALKEKGLQIETLPSTYQAEGLLEAILPHLEKGQHALLPRGDLAREYLPGKLRELGLKVTEVDVYETALALENAQEIMELIKNKEIHMITFTSSSTVSNLLKILSDQGVDDPAGFLKDIGTACIGPITAKTAEEFGLKVTHLAKEATIASLVDAMISSK